MSLIRLDDLAVSLSGRRVLNAIDLAVGGGEIVGLIGPNGVGKSTLLKVMAGLLEPNAGRATVDDRPLSSLAPASRAKRIAYLPQGGECRWPMTVAEVVALGRHAHHAPWRRRVADGVDDERAVADAIARAGLAALADRRMDELSGGERARALFARALAGETDFLLADEPLAGLDPSHQIQTMRILRALAAEGRGVVVVMHDLINAARFADRLVLLSGGRIVADGPPADVLTEDRLAAAYGVSIRRVTVDGTTIMIPWQPVDTVEVRP